MGRFANLVDSPSKIELFKEKYHIPQEVGLRYCSIKQIVTNREVGEVIIPIIAFIEGGITLPMGRITRDYLINHRLYKCHSQSDRGFYLKSRSPVVRLISCLPKSNKGMKNNYLIASGAWHDGLHCPTQEREPGGIP